MRNGVFFCDTLPDWVSHRIQRRIDIDPKRRLGEIESLKDRFLGNLGGAMFLLLPGIALWPKLAYRRRRLRCTEHLVFALHVHAFWFLALLTTAALLAVPIYTLKAMKHVYAAGPGRACGGPAWCRPCTAPRWPWPWPGWPWSPCCHSALRLRGHH